MSTGVVEEKVKQFLKKFDCVAAIELVLPERKFLYFLFERAPDVDIRKKFVQEAYKEFSPLSYEVLIINEMPLSQFTHILQGRKRIFKLDNKRYCSVASLMMTLALDFKYSTSEKMNLTFKKKILEVSTA